MKKCAQKDEIILHTRTESTKYVCQRNLAQLNKRSSPTKGWKESFPGHLAYIRCTSGIFQPQNPCIFHRCVSGGANILNSTRVGDFTIYQWLQVLGWYECRHLKHEAQQNYFYRMQDTKYNRVAFTISRGNLLQPMRPVITKSCVAAEHFSSLP